MQVSAAARVCRRAPAADIAMHVAVVRVDVWIGAGQLRELRLEVAARGRVRRAAGHHHLQAMNSQSGLRITNGANTGAP